MKKSLALLVVGMSAMLMFTACGSKETESNAEVELTQEQQEKIAEIEEEVEAAEAEVEEEIKEEEVEEASGTVEAWLETPDAEAVINSINEQLESQGCTCDFEAIGNDLSIIYTFTQDFFDENGLADIDIEVLQSTFEETLGPSLLENGVIIINGFQEGYGIDVENLKAVVMAPDGTELYNATKTSEEIMGQ